MSQIVLSHYKMQSNFPEEDYKTLRTVTFMSKMLNCSQYNHPKRILTRVVEWFYLATPKDPKKSDMIFRREGKLVTKCVIQGIFFYHPQRPCHGYVIAHCPVSPRRPSALRIPDSSRIPPRKSQNPFTTALEMRDARATHLDAVDEKNQGGADSWLRKTHNGTPTQSQGSVRLRNLFREGAHQSTPALADHHRYGNYGLRTLARFTLLFVVN